MSTDIPTWRIYCNTEQLWTQGLTNTIPTLCFTNSAHSVNLNSQQIISAGNTQLTEGNYTITSTLDSASLGTGALIVQNGGLSVATQARFGGNVTSPSHCVTGTSDSTLASAPLLVYGGATILKTLSANTVSIGSTNFNSISTVGGISANSLLTTNANLTNATISSTIDATAVGVAPFINQGGASFAKSVYIGGTLNGVSSILSGTLAVNGGSTLSGLNMNSTKITNLASPVNGTDATNKIYVDGLIQGLLVHEGVSVASVSNLVLSTLVPGFVVDGFTLTSNLRILLKNQTDATVNGVWIIQNSGPPQRSSDWASGTNVNNYFVFVDEGTINAASGWVENAPGGVNDVVGSSPLYFQQFSGAGQISAGLGIVKNGNTLGVNIDNSSLQFFNSSIRLSSGALGTGLSGGSGSTVSVIPNQSQITGLGQISSGTWQASAITVPYGGTGQVSLAQDCVLLGSGLNGINASSTLSYSAPGILTIGSTVASSSSGTGALVITSGGLGINGGTLNSTGVVNILNTSPASGSGNGALNVSGGLYAAKASFFNAGLTSATLTVNGTSVIGGVTTISNSSVSTQATSGALVVSGSIGSLSHNIGGSLSGNPLTQTYLNVSGGTFTDTSTLASGTVASKAFVSFSPANLCSSNTNVTTSNCSTVNILGAPTAGLNQTITNSYALSIAAGDVNLGPGTTTVGSFLSYNLPCGRFTEEQITGTNGGVFANNSWVTRNINTSFADPLSGVTLNTTTNVLTFNAGVYVIRAWATASNVNGHQIRLFNSSLSSIISIGSCAYAQGNSAESESRIEVKVTLSAVSTVILQHRSTSSGGSFGKACGFGTNELYSGLFVMRLM